MSEGLYEIPVVPDEELLAPLFIARVREIPGIFETFRQSLHRRCQACMTLLVVAVLNIFAKLSDDVASAYDLALVPSDRVRKELENNTNKALDAIANKLR
ncbi:hypothetical protein AVEN_78496-1 [Araneus ventricosus]|uniref:Uncharacterized protein n=1 Tax=Araneus ventricosus TaxID=182803 RepID=A0A4Y2EMK5_ARAVE|nr:hypothetical protein AVEN_78496-1 [Araneus ventricosus]